MTTTHQGYMDGISGQDPQHDGQAYNAGWVAGADDRAAGHSCDVTPKTLPKGLVVKILKGAPVRTTAKGQDKLAGRSFRVTVHDASYWEACWWGDKVIRPHQDVTWVGSGGYWHQCPIEYVEIPKFE